MGFELEDCQAAVENGKLSVNEAVEWLVAWFLNSHLIAADLVMLFIDILLLFTRHIVSKGSTLLCQV